MTDQQSNQDQPRLQLKPVEIGVGAGAALITAVASSALGVAGTISGAAVASVLTTVSTSLLRHSAHRTTRTLRGRVLPDRASAPATVAATATERDADRTVRLATGLADRPGPTYPGWPDRQSPTGWPNPPAPPRPAEHAPPGPGAVVKAKRGRPRWLLLAGASVAVFALAMAGITGLEAAMGRPLSSLFGHGGDGRSSVQQVFGGHGQATPATPTTPAPTGSAPASGGAAPTSTQQPAPTTPPAPPVTSDPAAPPATGDPGNTGAPGGGDAGGGDTNATP